MRKKRNWLPLLAVLVMAVLAMTTDAFAAGEEAAEYVSPFHATAWSLLPPVIAIGLALITKEVYSSLFIGILALRACSIPASSLRGPCSMCSRTGRLCAV